jgi:hypothetical protein
VLLVPEGSCDSYFPIDTRSLLAVKYRTKLLNSRELRLRSEFVLSVEFLVRVIGFDQNTPRVT